MKTRRNFESRLKEKLLHVGEGKFNIYIETLKRYRYPSSVYSSFPFDSSNKFHPKRTPQLCFPGESTYLWLNIGLNLSYIAYSTSSNYRSSFHEKP